MPSRWHAVLAFCCVALLQLSSASAAAQSAGRTLYSIGPPAAWVEPVRAEYDAPAPRDGVREGSYFLLYDTQIDVGPNGHDEYSHFAIRALTPAAVSSNAQLNISVDPSYQTLVLHFVRLRGRGETSRHDPRWTPGDALRVA